MPQLMPLNWISSSFTIVLILIMVLMLYSLVFFKKMLIKDKIFMIYKMNWWW